MLTRLRRHNTAPARGAHPQLMALAALLILVKCATSYAVGSPAVSTPPASIPSSTPSPSASPSASPGKTALPGNAVITQPATTQPVTVPALSSPAVQNPVSPGIDEDSAATMHDAAHQVATQQPSTTQSSLTQPSALTFESLAQLDEMVALGMSSLALSLLDDQQAPWPAYSPDWYALEHKRILLLAAASQWQTLLARSEQLLQQAKPDVQINANIRHWYRSQQVVAHLQLRQSARALEKARDLLWNPPNGEHHGEVISVLRQLVIRAYLQMHNHVDAQKALLRYAQDYPDAAVNVSDDWRMLQAHVLFRTGQYQDVITLLKDAPRGLNDAIRLIAQIRADPNNAYSVKQHAQQVLDYEAARSKQNISNDEAEHAALDNAQLWAYHYVIYEWALQVNDAGTAVIALEKMLTLGDFAAELGAGFSANADDLWKLYEQIGNASGNQHKLLLGDDAGWVELAKKLEQTAPVRAGSVYAVLALNAYSAEARGAAHQALVELLAQKPNGLEIVSQLYLRSKRITQLEALPAAVRFRLVDYALTTGKTDLAARLMQTLDEPPEAKNPFDWRMRKARVFVLQGDYAAGEQVLRKALQNLAEFNAMMLDQYLQVVFDMQAVKQHARALELFALIKDEWLDDKYRRELYFWKAESSYALEKYAQSAWQYLKSARAVDPAMLDPWSQSARFKAADALTRAGLYDDAYRMYDELLLMTASDNRRSWIKQSMQQIQLLRNAQQERAHETL